MMNKQPNFFENSESRRLLYFDVAKTIGLSRTTEELKKACIDATESFGYDYYLFGGYYPTVDRIVVSSSFPEEWRFKYDSCNYISIDPTVKHCWTNTKAVAWRKLEYSDGRVGELERKLMDEAFMLGLRSGISIPVHGSGAEGCMLSLVSSDENFKSDHHDEAGLQFVVHAIHEVTKRIISKEDKGVVPVTESLTPREIECLSWTAKGKTSWAISRILDVSESTIIFHLRNAIKKLEVTNRSHAVAKAVALSKITPF